jgi:hypothetical protein
MSSVRPAAWEYPDRSTCADRAGQTWTDADATLHGEFGHMRSTLTNILDRLERRKLVRRELNPTIAAPSLWLVVVRHSRRDLLKAVCRLYNPREH